MQFSASLLVFMSMKPLLLKAGHEERRDSFVLNCLIIIGGCLVLTLGINKCYENSRPSVNLRFLILIPIKFTRLLPMENKSVSSICLCYCFFVYIISTLFISYRHFICRMVYHYLWLLATNSAGVITIIPRSLKPCLSRVRMTSGLFGRAEKYCTASSKSQ